jgi:hypothetical protein
MPGSTEPETTKTTRGVAGPLASGGALAGICHWCRVRAGEREERYGRPEGLPMVRPVALVAIR